MLVSATDANARMRAIPSVHNDLALIGASRDASLIKMVTRFYLSHQLTVNGPFSQVALFQIATMPLHVVLEVTPLHGTINTLRDCFAKLCPKACMLIFSTGERLRFL